MPYLKMELNQVTSKFIVFVNEKSEVDGIVESMITKYKVRPEDIVGVSGSVNIRDRKDMYNHFTTGRID